MMRRPGTSRSRRAIRLPEPAGASRADSLCPMASHPDDRDLAGDDGEEAEVAAEDRPVPKSDRSKVGTGRTPPPGRRPPAAGSARSTRWAIDRLDERERRFSFVASGGAVALGIVVYLVENSAHFHRQKNQLSPQTVMLVGLVGGALLLGATFLGRRAPVGFVALFIGLLFSNSTLFLALPFLALAFWILYRSYKVQREASAEAAHGARRVDQPRPGGANSIGRNRIQTRCGERPDADQKEGQDRECRPTGGQQALYPEATAPAGPETLPARAQGRPSPGLIRPIRAR